MNSYHICLIVDSRRSPKGLNCQNELRFTNQRENKLFTIQTAIPYLPDIRIFYCRKIMEVAPYIEGGEREIKKDHPQRRFIYIIFKIDEKPLSISHGCPIHWKWN